MESYQASANKIVDKAATAQQGIAYRLIVERVEQELIEKALEITEGNQIVAAKVLGINRNTIRNKIRKFGIKVSKFKI